MLLFVKCQFVSQEICFYSQNIGLQKLRHAIDKAKMSGYLPLARLPGEKQNICGKHRTSC